MVVRGDSKDFKMCALSGVWTGERERERGSTVLGGYSNLKHFTGAVNTVIALQSLN